MSVRDYYDEETYDDYEDDYFEPEEETIKTISNKELENACKKFKVPSEVFKALALYDPKFFNKHGVVALKYHIVLLDRFGMLDELIEICDDKNNFDEISEALDVFRITTKFLYSYLTFVNELKKSNGLEKIYDIKDIKNIKTNLKKQAEKIKKYSKEHENLSEIITLVSVNYDSFNFEDEEEIKKAYPYDKDKLNFRTYVYNGIWDKKHSEDFTRRKA